MSTTDASQIHDLRSALDFLREMPGQLLETDTQVDPDAEVSGVYRHVGAGGTVMRPTKEGPAMVFNNVKGFDDAKVLPAASALPPCSIWTRSIWASRSASASRT